MKKLTYLLSAAVGAVLPVALAAPAEASLLNLSYQVSPGTTVSTILEGTLGADNNLFTITSLESVLLNGAEVIFNGSPIAKQLTVVSVDHEMDPSLSNTAVVSLDGSYVDFALKDANGNYPLAFAVGDLSSDNELIVENYGDQGVFAVQTDSNGGESVYSFVRSNYAAVAVPEPASMALLGLGMAGVLAARRRKAA